MAEEIAVLHDGKFRCRRIDGKLRPENAEAELFAHMKRDRNLDRRSRLFRRGLVFLCVRGRSWARGKNTANEKRAGN